MSNPKRQPDPDAHLGATEDEVDMKDTIPQRIDPKGHDKVEDLAGTGEHDSKGG